MICRKCSKKGRFAKCCSTRTDDGGKSGNVSAVEMVSTLEINLMADIRKPIDIPMKVEGKSIKLQMDTGCGWSLI